MPNTEYTQEQINEAGKFLLTLKSDSGKPEQAISIILSALDASVSMEKINYALTIAAGKVSDEAYNAYRNNPIVHSLVSSIQQIIIPFIKRAESAEKDLFTRKVLSEIDIERKRQDAKWGEQNHHPAEWLSILGEEFGEVCKAVCEAHFGGYESTGKWDQYRLELTHVAAVAVAMIECHDRPKPGICSVCGCTDDDCSQCIEKTGEPCHWVNPEHTICSACAPKELEETDA